MMVAGPSGVGTEKRSPLPFCGEKRSKRRGAGVKVRAKRLRRQQRAERVFRHMDAGRAEFERQFAAENARPHARAAVDRLDLEEPGVAIGAAAEAQDARAARRGGFRQPLELRRVAVEHRRSARLEAEEDLGLRVGDRFDRAEMFDVDGGDRRHEGDMRPRHAGERRDFARVIHADLEHAEAGARRHARERQRHAPVIVVGSGRGVRRAAGRRASRAASP